MRSMFHRDLSAPGPRAVSRTGGDPAAMYLTLTDPDGGLPTEVSPRRRLAALLIAGLVLLAAPLMWISAGDTPTAIAHGGSGSNSGPGSGGDDDDRSGPGDGDGGDDPNQAVAPTTTGVDSAATSGGVTQTDGVTTDGPGDGVAQQQPRGEGDTGDATTGLNARGATRGTTRGDVTRNDSRGNDDRRDKTTGVNRGDSAGTTRGDVTRNDSQGDDDRNDDTTGTDRGTTAGTTRGDVTRNDTDGERDS